MRYPGRRNTGHYEAGGLNCLDTFNMAVKIHVGDKIESFEIFRPSMDVDIYVAYFIQLILSHNVNFWRNSVQTHHLISKGFLACVDLQLYGPPTHFFQTGWLLICCYILVKVKQNTLFFFLKSFLFVNSLSQLPQASISDRNPIYNPFCVMQ